MKKQFATTMALLGMILAGCQENENASSETTTSSQTESTESHVESHEHNHEYDHNAEKQKEIYSGILKMMKWKTGNCRTGKEIGNLFILIYWMEPWTRF